MSSAWASAVKKLGARRTTRKQKDYHSIEITGGSKAELITLGTRLDLSLSDDMKAACTTDRKNKNVVKIMPHPSDDNKVVIAGIFKTPQGTCALEHRSNSSRYVLAINKDSKVLQFLRSEKDGGLFTYALRNMLMELQPSLGEYLDIPLQGNSIKGAPLCILDVPNKNILDYDSTLSPGHQATRYGCDDDEGFRTQASSLGTVLKRKPHSLLIKE